MDIVQEVTDSVVLYELYNKLKQRNVHREYWVHPMISDRLLTGHFYLKHPKLQLFPEKFFNYYRMSKSSFEELLWKLTPSLRKEDTNMRSCIPPEEMLALTLRYLATMNSLTDVAEKYCIGRSTAGEIVRKVCTDIWDVMKQECIPLPSTEKWKQMANNFQTRAHFPNCIGAIDGKHIRVTKPYNSGSLFHNYKNYFSIVLLALADSDYRFIYVNIGAYGKDSDCNILKNSSLWTGLTQNTLGIPQPAQFPGATSPLPYVIVGDEAFGLTSFLLTPYSGHNLTPKKRIFNYRLTLARRYVECTFGLLSNKWRIFHRALNTSVDFSVDIVKACCVLHNYVRDRDGFRLEDTLNLVGFEDIDIDMDNAGSRANVQEIRNEFATYFTSNVGSVPWQNRAIM